MACFLVCEVRSDEPTAVAIFSDAGCSVKLLRGRRKAHSLADPHDRLLRPCTVRRRIRREREHRMKIIDILTYGVNLGGNHVFVKVLTDEHLYGIGEAYRVGPDEAVEQVIHYFKDWLIGEDPTRIEHLWRLLYNGSRFPGGSMVNAAISGIEIALWDLKGKAYGVPVYQLLGGRCRDRIRVYRGAGGGATPQQVKDEMREVIQKQGFTAIKVAPQPAHYQQLPWGQVLR